MPIETTEFELKAAQKHHDAEMKQKEVEIQQLSDDLNSVGNENVELKAASERKDAEIADMKQIIDNLQDVRRKQDNVRADKDARIAELEQQCYEKDVQHIDEIAALKDDILCIDVSGLQHEIQVLKEKLESDNEYWAAKCKALEEKLATAEHDRDHWARIVNDALALKHDDKTALALAMLLLVPSAEEGDTA
nr:hypothetical protein [Candidatus Sigynarchaeota archaeon]